MLQPHQWAAVCWPDLVSNTENNRDRSASCRGLYFGAGWILLLCFGLASLSAALSCFWAVLVVVELYRAVPCFITEQWSLLSWTSWKPLSGFLWAGHPRAASPGSHQKAELSLSSIISVSKELVFSFKGYYYIISLGGMGTWEVSSLFSPFLKVSPGIYIRGNSCSGSQLVAEAVTSPLLKSLQDRERISSFTISCFLTISLISYGPTTHLVDPCRPFTGTAATAAAASVPVSGDDTACR